MAQLDLSTRMGAPSRTETKDKYASSYPQIASFGEPFLVPEDTKRQDRVPSTEKTESPLTSAARFAYMPATLGGGQYIIEPTTKPGETVKTIRKTTKDLEPAEKIIREMLRGGLSSNRVEIDHIIPLWLGGGDTLYNLEPLAKPDHEVKNKVDAVVRTLYWAKDENGNPLISPKEAQNLVMNWRGKDVEGVFPDENNYGTINLNLAKQKYEEWKNPKQAGALDAIKAALYHLPIIGNIGEKIFGSPNKTTQQVLDAWHEGPKSDLGAGWQALTSAATLGWIPFPEGRPEEQDVGRFAATTAGSVLGTLIPYGIAVKALSKLTGLGALAKSAAAVRGAKTAADLKTATQAADTLAKSYKLGQASLRFLSTPAGRFLTSTDPLFVKGITPSIAKYLPNVTGKTIGRMITEAGLWGLMSQVEREDEYSLENQMTKLLSSMGKGATMGAVAGKASPLAFAGLGTSVYAINKAAGMSDKDALADAALMMGLHGTFYGLSKLSLPQYARDIPLKLNTLDTIIQNRLRIEMENSRLRLSDKLGEELPVGAITKEEMNTEVGRLLQKAEENYRQNGDPVEFKNLSDDILLYYKYLNAKGMTPYEKQQRAMDDINSLFNREAQGETTISQTVPEKINWWALEPRNQRYVRNGLLESMPENVTNTENAPIGTFQGTGTAMEVSPYATENIRSLTQAAPGETAVRRELPAMAVLREDWAGGIEALNRRAQSSGTGRIYENPADNVQIVTFDPNTGQPLHITVVPTKDRIGEVVRDTNGKITGASPDAPATSINKQIEIHNNNVSPEYQWDYVDPELFNNSNVANYIRQNNGKAMPVSLEVIGTSGSRSNRAYAMVKITPDHAKRVVTEDMLPTELPSAVEAATPAEVQTANVREQISRAAATARGESVETILGQTSSSVDHLNNEGKVYLTGLIDNVSGRLADNAETRNVKNLLGYNEATGKYKVDGVEISPKDLTLKAALKNLRKAAESNKEGARLLYDMINRDINYIRGRANPAEVDALTLRLAKAPLYGEAPVAKSGQIQQKLPLESAITQPANEAIRKAIATVPAEKPQEKFKGVVAKTQPVVAAKEAAAKAKQIQKTIAKNPAKQVETVNKAVEALPEQVTGPNKVKAKTTAEAAAIAEIYKKKTEAAGATEEIITIDTSDLGAGKRKTAKALGELSAQRKREGVGLEFGEERPNVEETPREISGTLDTLDRETSLISYAKRIGLSESDTAEMLNDNFNIWSERDSFKKGMLKSQFAKKWGFDWRDYYPQEKVAPGEKKEWLDYIDLIEPKEMSGPVMEEQFIKSSQSSKDPNVNLLNKAIVDKMNLRAPGWNMEGSVIPAERVRSLFSEKMKIGEDSTLPSSVEKTSSAIRQYISDVLLMANVNPSRLTENINGIGRLPKDFVNLFLNTKKQYPDAIRIETFPTKGKAVTGRYVNISDKINALLEKKLNALISGDVAYKTSPEERFADLHLSDLEQKSLGVAPQDLSVKTIADALQSRTNNSMSWALSPTKTIGIKNMTPAEIALVADEVVNLLKPAFTIPVENIASGRMSAKEYGSMISQLELKRQQVKERGILDLYIEEQKNRVAKDNANATPEEKAEAIGGLKDVVDKFRDIQLQLE